METEDEDGKQEKKIPIFLEQNFTQFGQKLWDSRTDLKTTLIDDLKAMGPSAIGKYDLFFSFFQVLKSNSSVAVLELVNHATAESYFAQPMGLTNFSVLLFINRD